MSKKHDFLRSEQSRDKHPESEMVGSAASVEEEQRRTSVQNVSRQDRQEPHRGKIENDHNKMGQTHPTQKNEGQRTPESRHDRQVMAGGTNVVQARTGGKGGGRGTRGGNVGGSST
ncbi:hypothetical protein [Ramlibacter aurantiacus]|uniref:hypothetical protein n=1 Tax=Ramlibacter aurantiacus TaxID=2801330 RepID=UPI001F2C54D3|nr:hypothetical protein [Ramlibacter aurantiacus]